MVRFRATDAQAYEHFMARWSHRLAGPFLDFAGVKGGDRVLDVGCGTGVITAALAGRGGGGAWGWPPGTPPPRAPAATDLIRTSSMSWATRVTCRMRTPRSMPAS